MTQLKIHKLHSKMYEDNQVGKKQIKDNQKLNSIVSQQLAE